MKEKKQLFTFSIFIIILISSIGINITIPAYATTPPSHYSTPQSVKCSVEVNFTISDTAGTKDYNVILPRFDNIVPTSPMWGDTPPYQESTLLYHNISPIPYNYFLWTDRFNNTYDHYNKTNLNGNLKLSQHYNITLNEVIFSNITDSDIGEYDWNDNIFSLYCNTTEEFYNIRDTDLIYASNNLTGINPTDNPIKKAERIYNWVSNYLTYDDSLVKEMGASWAYDNHRGDCSEYSSLMITLLRIQHIPARKVTGYVISNNPNLKPSVGQKFNFFFNAKTGDGNLLGHAWVEYYVENIGWIPADPTWAGSNQNYFNRIDYLRFTDNVGANWTIPPFPDVYGEFPFPYITATSGADPSSVMYTMDVTVLETNLNPDNFMMIIIIAVIIGVVVVVTALVFLAVKKSKNRIRYTY
ncbi:MAG: transglutaminase domain-containing protein [Candidatus Lokiarchaeota archaeon]|nr:transglutaminase domain-containing protein [Candidatus Lokiarchaeota archaeon]